VLRLLVPRFLIVVVAAPLAFVAALYGAQRFGFDADAVAGVAAAVTFAAVALAPSHKNASMRALLLLSCAAVFAGVAALAGNAVDAVSGSSSPAPPTPPTNPATPPPR
jgi:hypothetical protein